MSAIIKHNYIKDRKVIYLMKKVEQLQKMIDNAKNIVVLSGAGTSTDSGLKDFRSQNGLYHMKASFSPEEMLSSKMFYQHPEKFYAFYRENLNSLNAKPNSTHLYLKKLEDEGKLKAIITQNIDGLHTKAGNKKVYEIHGTIYKNYCTLCHEFYCAEEIFKEKSIPKCKKCGGIVKPDVVLYGEMLPPCFEEAQYLITQADLLIVIGTSLLVQPASSLIHLFQGKNLVIINESETPYDNCASLVIHDNLSKIFQQLK